MVNYALSFYMYFQSKDTLTIYKRKFPVPTPISSVTVRVDCDDYFNTLPAPKNTVTTVTNRHADLRHKLTFRPAWHRSLL